MLQVLESAHLIIGLFLYIILGYGKKNSDRRLTIYLAERIRRNLPIDFFPEAAGGGVSDECFLSLSGVSRCVGELLGESDIAIIVVIDVTPSPPEDELELCPSSEDGKVLAESASLKRRSKRITEFVGGTNFDIWAILTEPVPPKINVNYQNTEICLYT